MFQNVQTKLFQFYQALSYLLYLLFERHYDQKFNGFNEKIIYLRRKNKN